MTFCLVEQTCEHDLTVCCFVSVNAIALSVKVLWALIKKNMIMPGMRILYANLY